MASGDCVVRRASGRLPVLFAATLQPSDSGIDPVGEARARRDVPSGDAEPGGGITSACHVVGHRTCRRGADG
jgi:hypothetical protein